MKSIKYFCLLLCLTSAGYAQQSSSLAIKFHYSSKKVPDTLSLWTYPKHNYWDNSTDYLIKKDINQIFNFKFPKINNLMNYRINSTIGLKTLQIGNYFAQPGDKVVLNIYQTKGDGSLIFSGQGSEKYQLIQALAIIENKFKSSLKLPGKNTSEEELNANIRAMHTIVTTAQKQKQNLILSYKKINTDMKSLIGYHCANYERVWINYFLALRKAFNNNSVLKPIIKAHFNQYYPQFLDRSSPISFYSQRHFQLLLNMMRYKLMFNSEMGTIDLRAYYKLAKYYSTDPLIRDRLLAQFFVYDGKGSSNYSQSVFDSLAKDASRFVQSTMAKEVLSGKLLFRKGSQFFDSSFTDLNGQLLDTRSLRGKVFLLDGWGEGCGGCMMFHKWFKSKVWPEVKDIADFLVLSVFDGKTKTNWNRGITSKKYTSDHYLNVSTIPTGNQGHPFFKHYGVNYLPFLLLVDKQGMVVAKLKGVTDPTAFAKLIKKLVNQP